MKYTKPALNFREQAERIISRGLHADLPELENFLSRVNYYRLSQYLFPFRSQNDDRYIEGTSFAKIKQIYHFDSELRLLSLSAIEVIDVAILRTQMVEKFSLSYGPFCYLDIRNFSSGLDRIKHNEILNNIQNNFHKSKEEFIEKYRINYQEENYLPFWMVAEISSIGTLSTIFQYLPNEIRIPISRPLKLHTHELVSWLRTLSNIRNFCAHHSRIWDRKFPLPPARPAKKVLPEFYFPARVENNCFLFILFILRYLTKIISHSNDFLHKLHDLIERYPEVPFHMMGFPENWQEYPLLKLS